MTRAFCEREHKTAASVRREALDHETASHAQECAVCSEIVLVSRFLNEDCALGEHGRTALPDPMRIWQEAQLRAKKEAMRRALRPIRYMRVLACIAFACSPWLRLLLQIGREFAGSWSQTLGINIASASKFWPVMANQSIVLLGAFGTIVLLGLSSWYMLRQE